jgi:DNA-binding MarR family transcriptional regulator
MTDIYELFIIDKRGLTLFRQVFVENAIDSDLISSFMTAIEAFSKSVFSSIDEGINSSLKSIERGGSKLIIEKGEYITGIIFAKYDEESIRLKLNALIESFQKKYKTQLLNPSSHSTTTYHGFTTEVLKKFHKYRIYHATIPIIRKTESDYSDLSNTEIDFLLTIDTNPGLTISEIAHELNQHIYEIIEIVSLLNWKKYIDLKESQIIKDNSIFKINIDIEDEIQDAIIRNKISKYFGNSGITIFYENNGSKSILDISKKLGIDKNIIKQIINFFLAKDWIIHFDNMKDSKESKRTPLTESLSNIGFEFIKQMKHLTAYSPKYLDAIKNVAKKLSIEICSSAIIFRVLRPSIPQIANKTSTVLSSLYTKLGSNIHLLEDSCNENGFSIIIKECFECKNISDTKPICSFTTGLIEGILEYYKLRYDIIYNVEETHCIAKNDLICQWNIKTIGLKIAEVYTKEKTQFWIRLIKKESRKKSGIYIVASDENEVREIIKREYPDYSIMEIIKSN